MPVKFTDRGLTRPALIRSSAHKQPSASLLSIIVSIGIAQQAEVRARYQAPLGGTSIWVGSWADWLVVVLPMPGCCMGL